MNNAYQERQKEGGREEKEEARNREGVIGSEREVGEGEREKGKKGKRGKERE